MKASGKKTKNLVLASTLILMEIYTKGNGSMMKDMEEALCSMQMAINMRETGNTTNKVDWGHSMTTSQSVNAIGEATREMELEGYS